MQVAMGTVVDGKDILEGVVLPEGALVTVLTSDAQASIRLSPAEEADLVAALEDADQAVGAPAGEVLERLRKYG